MISNHGDRFRPQDLGLWDPFQMAELHGVWMGMILTTYDTWDDAPSGVFSEATLKPLNLGEDEAISLAEAPPRGPC